MKNMALIKIGRGLGVGGANSNILNCLSVETNGLTKDVELEIKN